MSLSKRWVQILILCLFPLHSIKAEEREEQEGVSDLILGIDLGTTYSCAGIYDGGVNFILNSQNDTTTPSIVAIDENNNVLVGQNARNFSGSEKRILFDSKRILGRTYKEVKKHKKHWAFEIVEKGDLAHYKVGEETYPATFVSSCVLRRIRMDAENQLGRPINQAVVTVPAYFTDAQRKDTLRAAREAGIQVKRIINEPTAAAIAYGLEKKGSRNVMVYDLGGGTFDISILELDDGVYDVKASGGDSQLGGQDFNIMLAVRLMKTLDAKEKYESDGKFRRAVMMEVERVKRALSVEHSAEFLVEFDNKEYKTVVTRAAFENAIKKAVRRTLKKVKEVLLEAKMKAADIDDVVMVGGSTRIVYVKEQVAKLLGKKVMDDINPDTAVAYGATIQAAILSDSKISDELSGLVVADITPLSLGIETEGGVMAHIIKKNEKIPTSSTERFTTAHREQDSVLLNVYQGEWTKAKRNTLLGSLHVDGIAKNKPTIFVTFRVDVNGNLTVHLKDDDSGTEKELFLEGIHGNLTKEELLRREAEYEKFKFQDDLFKKVANKKREIKNTVEQATSQIKDKELRKKLFSHQNKADGIEETDEGLAELDTILADIKDDLEEAGHNMGGEPDADSEAEGDEDADEDFDDDYSDEL